MPTSATRDRPPANREPEADVDDWEYGPDAHRAIAPPALDANLEETTGGSWWLNASRDARVDYLTARWRKRDANYRVEAVALIQSMAGRWERDEGPHTGTHHKAKIVRYLADDVARVLDVLEEVADQLYPPRATYDGGVAQEIERRTKGLRRGMERAERWADELDRREAEPQIRRPRG